MHHLVHEFLAVAAFGIALVFNFAALLFEPSAGFPFSLGAVFASGVFGCRFLVSEGPNLFVRKFPGVFPLHPFGFGLVGESCLLHFGLVPPLVLTALFFGILHCEELPELLFVLFPFKFAPAFFIVEVHVALALFEVQPGFRNAALLFEFLVEAAVFVIIAHCFHFKFLADYGGCLVGLAFHTDLLEFDTVAKLHHPQGHPAFVGSFGEAVFQFLKFFFLYQSGPFDFHQGRITFGIAAGLPYSAFVLEKGLEFFNLVFMKKPVLVYLVYTSFKFQFGCRLVEHLRVLHI